MKLEPIHIVDTLQVAPADAMTLLMLLRDEGIPVMKDAGLEFVSCYSTSPDLGEDVLVQVTWKVANHAAFNLIRKTFVLDPRWHAYSAKASKLWRGGTRRFFYPSPVEMPK